MTIEYSVLKEVELLFANPTVVNQLQQYWTPEQYYKGRMRNEDSTQFCITGTTTCWSPLPEELKKQLNELLCKEPTNAQVILINSRYVINPDYAEILRYYTVAYYDKDNHRNRINWPAINDVFGYDAVIDVLTLMESGKWQR